MSEQDSDQQAADGAFDPSDTEGRGPDSEGAHTPGRTDEQAPADGPDALSRLQAERDELESRLLRVSADYQNFAKRAQQNTQQAVEHKVMDMARDLATVLDHFDRALDVDTAGEQAGVLQGVTMVREELLATLGRFGIERIDVEPGTEFDPNRHEALMRQPSDDIESDHVTMQMLPGYLIGDKVIRPAQVGVAE